MKRLVYILLLLCPFTLFGQDLYVTDSSVTHYLTDSSQTYYIYHDLSEQALLYLNGTTSTINNKIDTIFDENNSYNAIQTDTSKSPSVKDGAWEFDGDNDYMKINDSDDLSFVEAGNDKPFSVSLWAKFDGTPSGIVTKYNTNYEYIIYIVADELRFIMYEANSLVNRIGRRLDFPAECVNEWFHYTFVYDGSKTEAGVKIHINASRVDDNSISNGSYTGMSNTGEDVWIGNFQLNTSSFSVNGSIDEVMIFDRALQPSEITELYER